jgi:hypothetical protein
MKKALLTTILAMSLQAPIQAQGLDMRVGQIKGTINETNKSYSCTGTLIGEDYLITSIDCLFEPKTGKQYDQLEFLPSRPNNLRKYSRGYINDAWIASDYEKHLKIYSQTPGKKSISFKTEGMLANNVAILKVDFPINNATLAEKLGSYGLTYLDSKLENLPITMISDVANKNSKVQKKQSCNASSDDSMYHHFNLDNCKSVMGGGGSPIIYTNSDDEKRVIGVLSMVLNRGDRAGIKTTIIHNEMRKDIEKITNNETTGIKYFKNYKFNTKNLAYLGIDNKCNEEVRVALRVKDLDNNWSTKGFYSVKANSTSSGSIPTDNGIYYFYAQSADGTKVWEGKDNYRTLYGTQYGFKKRKIYHKGDSNINLTCK